MMQKNETAIVTIEDIGVNGEGIGKVDGYTLFILKHSLHLCNSIRNFTPANYTMAFNLQ